MAFEIDVRLSRGELWLDWFVRVLADVDFTPFRIALLYLTLGMFALFLSDVLLLRYIAEPQLSRVQAVKGGLEVFLSAGLIYALTTRSRQQVVETKDHLEEQREELDLLHRVLRHNLRNDLNVIRGYAELIREKQSKDHVPRECERVINTALKMERYTEQAQRIRKVTSGNSRRTVVDLTTSIDQLLDENPLVTSDVEVTVEYPEETRVEVNPMFVEALDELITNGIKHNDSETPELRIEVASVTRSVEIRVVDNGSGIPESEVELLRKSTGEQIYHLSGMGLWFVKWVVDHSNGELTVQSSTEGADVRVTVPRAVNIPIQSLERNEPHDT